MVKSIAYSSTIQVVMEYRKANDGGLVPLRAHTIVVSAQHEPNVSNERIFQDLLDQVVMPVCGKWVDDRTIFKLNPSGRFVIGGPSGDAGLTG